MCDDLEIHYETAIKFWFSFKNANIKFLFQHNAVYLIVIFALINTIASFFKFNKTIHRWENDT